MFWLLVAVQWLHVICAIFWFGAVLVNDFLVIPSVMSLPLPVQGQFGAAYGPRADRVIVPVSVLTILFGIIRGVSGGVLGSLGTAYGVTWVVALFLGIGVAAFGAMFIGRLAKKLPSLAGTPEFAPTIALLKRNSTIELLGFLVIFSMMIAMRFGY